MSVKSPEEDQLNPAARQEHDLTNFEKEFGNRQTLDEGIASKEGAVEQARSRLGNEQANVGASLADAEQNFANNTPQQPQATSASIAAEEQKPPSLYRPTSGGIASGGGLGRKLRNKWLIGSIIGLMSGVFVAATTIPQAMLIHIKEVASRWMDKNNWNSNSRRAKKIMKKWFTADANCKSGVKCRYKAGVSEAELKKMRDGGLDPQTEKVGDKTRVTSFGSVDAQGRAIRVDASQFESHFSNNPRFRSNINFVLDPRASTNLGKWTIDVIKRFGASRKKFSDKTDPKEIEKDYRKRIYSTPGQDLDARAGECDKGANGACAENEEQKRQRENIDRQMGDAISEIKNKAAEDRARIANGEPPRTVPDMTHADTVITPSNAATVVGSVVRNAGLSLLKGVYAIAEHGCAALQFLRIISVGSKVLKLFDLIAFGIVTLANYEAPKAGDGSYALTAYLAGLLLRPSVEEGSKGKTFFDGPLLGLMTEGKVNDRKSLGRFTSGTPALRMIDQLYAVVNGIPGISPSSCKHITSWYGQLFGFATGILTLIFTGGTVNIGSIAANISLSVFFSIFTSYMTPILVQMVAGTTAPDPKDPQGGFGISSGLTAAISFFRHERSKSSGERPLMASESAQVQQEVNEEIAKAERAANLDKNPFSIDEPNSITSKLAMTLAPYVLAPTASSNYQNIAALVASPLNLIAGSFGKILTPAVGAQATTDGFGGEFCKDRDIKQLGMAADAMCAPVDGEQAAILEAPKYEPQKVLDYMLANDHIDDSGAIKSEDYKDFTNDCIEGVMPITADGLGVDFAEDIDTRKCLIRDTKTIAQYSPYKTAQITLADAASDAEAEKITMFRLWRKDSGIDQDITASVNDKLGLDEGASSGGGGGEIVGPQNPGAFVWPVSPSSVSTISSCMNLTDRSYRIHAGLDIAAPQNTPIVSVADGQVVFEGKNVGGFQYYVAVKHANGSITGYGHNQENLVKEGDNVKQGQKIATVGTRGQSTGYHLHMNYIPDGSSVFTTEKNAANPLFNNLMPKPADVPDPNGCTQPPKLKAR